MEWTWSQDVRLPPAKLTMHMPCLVIARDQKVTDGLAVFMYRTKSGHWMFEWANIPPEGTPTDAVNAKHTGTMPLSSVVTWSAQDANLFDVAFLRMTKHIQKVWNKEWGSTVINVDAPLEGDLDSIVRRDGSNR